MNASEDSGRNSVGAPVPPPAVFAAAILAGFALNLAKPLPLPIPVAAARIAGGILILGGFALGLAALRSLAAGGSSPIPHRPSKALVVGGIYRWTRNPIYLSMAVLVAGVAVLARSGWHLAMVALLVVVLDLTQIRREERYLEGNFGDAFRDYCRRTRRWI
jgi:protein-S-isoprenylcysteine O-methyltransferase Ste14